MERGFAASNSCVGELELQSLQPEFMSIYCGRATQLSELYPGAQTAIQAFHESGVTQAVGMTIGLVTHGYARQPVETLGADFLISNLATLPNELGFQAQDARVARCSNLSCLMSMER